MGTTNRYVAVLEKVFLERYKSGMVEIPFERQDLADAAESLGLKLPKNLGDVIYSIRYRTGMPDAIRAKSKKNMEWIIEGTGRAKYVFRLVKLSRIEPNPKLVETKIPDATPEIVAAYALSDEQALLAKVRYNRIVDLFLGVAAYSLQNHLRTTVQDVGQIEIDEIYVGLDKYGCHYVIPLQAKGGNDRLSVVQAKQDILCCTEKFPHLICRPLSAQFISDDLIAMFELTLEKDEIRIVDERHYKLVPSEEIGVDDLRTYLKRTK